MTAWHCRARLPHDARLLVQGALGTDARTGPMDDAIAVVPAIGVLPPLACDPAAERGNWRGQPVRFSAGAIAGTVTVDRAVHPGDSGAPVLSDRGELATMVIGLDRSTGLGVALHPRVACAAVELARERLGRP